MKSPKVEIVEEPEVVEPLSHVVRMVDSASFDLVFELDGPAQHTAKVASNLGAYISARLEAGFAPLHVRVPETLPKVSS